MLLQEAIEEFIEVAPQSGRSMQSIIRKLETTRNQLLRTYGRDVVPYWMDINAGQAEYPLIFPPGSLHSVLVDGQQYRYAQLQATRAGRYYYTYMGVIGLVPAPDKDIPQGMTIFYKKTAVPLTVDGLSDDLGFDPDYDQLVVYGALLDILRGAEYVEYKNRYDGLLTEYLRTETTPEPVQIQLESW